MNLKSFLPAATVTVTLFSCRDIREGTADYAIIPLPQHTEVTPQTKPFILDKGTVIVTPENDNEMKTIAGFLNAYIDECTGYTLATSTEATKNYITLNIDKSIKNPEGYRLAISSDGITITGGSHAGVFYGVQTLRKASPVEASDKIAFRQTNIEDYPRLAYRGMHLDAGRHFFNVEQVKQYLDLMALHNLNVFHWHLTEDQGWRIEIKKNKRPSQ